MSQITLVPIGAVRPSTYNPRESDPARLDLIELSLRKLGFLLPLYADPAGELLSGHQRHLVAGRLGCTRVPVCRTKAFDLDERKAINIVFNRGTNDLAPADTPANLTAALERVDLDALAAAIPDKTPDTPAFYPCLAAKTLPLQPLLERNRGRGEAYAHNISRTLYVRGIRMPVIATPDGKVINGVGRLSQFAERKETHIEVVTISEAEAALADAFLNLLSMDFNLEDRYRDLLRHNSFRRVRRQRSYLGHGFTFAVIGTKHAKSFDIKKAADRERWIRRHGRSIVDFGAGHLQETEMLRTAGVQVTPFEPYRLGADMEIDKAESVALARAFLADVAGGKVWTSVFISSVLNSVPFLEDREAIATICAALCGPSTALYAHATSVAHESWRLAAGTSTSRSCRTGRYVSFRLDYEPGIKLGDFQDKPKVQKCHTRAEFKALFAPHFQDARVQDAKGNVMAVCRDPRAPDAARLRKAIELEFDLPYPDGSRMNLVDEALAAFAERLRITL